jgi:hypothetical protein
MFCLFVCSFVRMLPEFSILSVHRARCMKRLVSKVHLRVNSSTHLQGCDTVNLMLCSVCGEMCYAVYSGHHSWVSSSCAAGVVKGASPCCRPCHVRR